MKAFTKSSGATFAEWFEELCNAAERFAPWCRDYVKRAGEDSWRDGYEDDMTPQEQFDSDRSYWEA